MTQKRCHRSQKRKLMTEAIAIGVALRMSIKYGIPFSFYHCSGTQHWHVTKKEQGKKSWQALNTTRSGHRSTGTSTVPTGAK